MSSTADLPGANPESSLGFPVVGIGASAGGIQALSAFFENMPAESGMAFVVVQHLAPSHHSNIESILQRTTRMRVTEVTSPTPIEKNTVYVISPAKQLTMNDGYLRVTDMERPPGQQVAVDVFFRTLAEVHRLRAFGIILSGTGADGVVGMGRIRAEGGVTFAQHPDDAEFSGMPDAAIQAGVVDFVLPVVEIPQKLLDIWRNAQAIELPPIADGDKAVREAPAVVARPDAEEALRDVITILRARTNHDFRHYKRATVLRRVERRLQVRALPDVVSYRELLKGDPEESKALLKDMLIGVTQFFRDRDVFDALERDFIPALFDKKDSNDQLRAWSAGCATGEEPYSLAMLLSEHADTLSSPPALQVFATDIDEHALAVARSGLYPAPISTDVTPSRLHRFFTTEGDRFQIKKSVRDKVLFAVHNILRDPPFSRLDMISCRNLLIYLDRDIQKQVLEMFHFALNPNGLLVLGNSEAADALQEHFVTVDKKNRVYRTKNIARAMRLSTLLPAAGLTPPIVPAPVQSASQRKFSFDDVHQRALAKYAPPSLVVNKDAEILHMSENAGKFLRHVGGEPTRNLLALIAPELRLEIRAALFQATQSGQLVEARRILSDREDGVFHVHMSVHPVHDDNAAADFFLIIFNEIEQVAKGSPEGEPGGDQTVVVTALEEDLERTKAQLQDTIEHSESSTEELKASNEELQAINEELRSATEELETSREELQSVNEELVTVNYELKCTVEETGKVNDDLQNLIASTDIATIFVDRSMRIKRYTPRATDIFNIIAADVGRSLHDITHKLDYADLATDAEAAFDTLRVVEREVHGSNGCHYISRLLPYRTTDDRIEGAILTFIDITRRHKAEEDLRIKEERMRLVAESTKDYAIITLDVTGNVTSFNTGAEKIFGYSQDEMLGHGADVIFTPEDRGNSVPEEEKRHALTEGCAEYERWHQRKDGTRFFCSSVMTPLLENGRLYGYAKIGRDLTGRAQAENQRQDLLTLARLSRAEAQAASTLKDEFLAIMSHELRYPLNLIHMNAELLMHMPEFKKNPVYAHAGETILNSAANQAKIINDLLDLSRLNTGKLALSVHAVEVVKIVDAVVQLVRNDKTACQVVVEADRDNPLFIKGDASRIEQVVSNLVSNAIKYTPREGLLRIRLSAEDERLRLDVIDNGAGISAQFLPHVFDIFKQANKADAGKSGGLGIGMALVKQIVDLHGGHVTVASEGAGTGAHFTVWFPLMDKSELFEKLPVADIEDSIAGLRILAVDDHVDGLEILKILLEMHGGKVDTVGHARDALHMLSATQYDLVIADVGMPDMDGYAFIAEVRRLPAYALTPVIAVTGYSRPQDVTRALKAGFSDHLSKPLALDKLLETVKRLNMQSAEIV